MSEMTTLLTEAFDVEREGTSKFEPLPAGVYVAAINDIGVKPLKSGKGQQVVVVWEVDEYGGRLLWQQIIVAHESAQAMKFGRQKFKDLCDACGATGQITDLSVLQGKSCLVFVKIETDPSGEYPPKNKVVRTKAVGAMAPKTNGKADFDDTIPF